MIRLLATATTPPLAFFGYIVALVGAASLAASFTMPYQRLGWAQEASGIGTLLILTGTALSFANPIIDYAEGGTTNALISTVAALLVALIILGIFGASFVMAKKRPHVTTPARCCCNQTTRQEAEESKPDEADKQARMVVSEDSPHCCPQHQQAPAEGD